MVEPMSPAHISCIVGRFFTADPLYSLLLYHLRVHLPLELEHTQLERGGELVQIHLQHNKDGMEFSCKKTLGGKGLKPLPTFGCADGKGWWTSAQEAQVCQV